MGAVIMFLGSIASVPAATISPTLWVKPEFALMAVDMVVAAAFLILALRSKSYWPLWVTAFQIIAVTIHVAFWVAPKVVPIAYAMAQGFQAYPMLAIIIWASISHQKSDVRSVSVNY